MKNSVFFIYLLILAGSTYLIRVIPFIAIKEKINNSFVRSFLYYIPYAVLTAMTIPAVFYATNWWVGAAAGLIAAVIFALKGNRGRGFLCGGICGRVVSLINEQPMHVMEKDGFIEHSENTIQKHL